MSKKALEMRIKLWDYIESQLNYDLSDCLNTQIINLK